MLEFYYKNEVSYPIFLLEGTSHLFTWVGFQNIFFSKGTYKTMKIKMSTNISP